LKVCDYWDLDKTLFWLSTTVSITDLLIAH